MPLTQAQQLVCAMLFGTTVGVVSTTTLKKTPSRPSQQKVASEKPVNAEKSRTISLPGGDSITIFDSPVLGNCITPDLEKEYEVPDLRKPSPPVFPVTYPNTPGGGVTSQVPEPDTWVMLVSGFGFVGLSLRRKKSSA